jgi:hypothetical protein
LRWLFLKIVVKHCSAGITQTVILTIEKARQYKKAKLVRKNLRDKSLDNGKHRCIKKPAGSVGRICIKGNDVEVQEAFVGPNEDLSGGITVLKNMILQEGETAMARFTGTKGSPITQSFAVDYISSASKTGRVYRSTRRSVDNKVG